MRSCGPSDMRFAEVMQASRFDSAPSGSYHRFLGRMSSGSGDKPGSGSSASTAQGRPAADTPGRLVVRNSDGGGHEHGESATLVGSDTAVAVAHARDSGARSANAMLDTAAVGPTPAAGTPSISMTGVTEIVGTTLSGRYQVTRKIGQGGMGAVYEATHTLIGKRVAIKVLLEKYAQREAIVKRLKQEAQLAASIGNDNIINITDFGSTEDGRTFVVMEYLEGESMAECLSRETSLPEQRILRIAAQTASALAAAHAKGVVHRDIKPENIFLLKRKDEDFVKVVDFGISKSLRATDEQEEKIRLTQTGMVLGTPLYMSPEQARGDDDLDHRVDIYALGIIMYEAASGRVPFSGNNYLSVISQVLNEEPKPLREIRPELSEEFDAIVLKAIAKNRNDRYENATDMLADLNALIDDPTHSTERAKITSPRKLLQRQAQKIPRIAWAIGGAGIVAAGVAIAVMVLMGGKQKKLATEKPQLAATLDAGVAGAGVIDGGAGGAEPAVETIKLKIVTDPPGADVYREDEFLGKSPTPPIAFAKNNKYVKITAQHAGFDDATVSINPLERTDGSAVSLKLKKAKGERKTTKMRPPGPGSGSAATGGGTQQPVNQTGGELGTNPFGTGSAPKKP
jgi:tRNA A-37 threonylcarbamoyl transferase component Bud32